MTDLGSMQLVAQGETRASLPLGEWFDSAVDWCDNELKWLFDRIAWPLNQVRDILYTEDNVMHSPPRFAVVAALVLLAFLGGGRRRALVVGAAAMVLAFMKPFIWSAGLETMVHMTQVLAVSAVIATAVVAAVQASETRSRRTLHVMTGWGFVHPHLLLLPVVFFFGFGETSSVMLTIIAALPLVVDAALRECEPGSLPSSSPDGGSHAPSLASRVRIGLRSAFVPALFILIFMAFIGAGGLSRFLFRGLTNQDPVLAGDAGIALWLIAIIGWQLLGPWSHDHLRRQGRLDAENEPARVAVDIGVTDVASPSPPRAGRLSP